MTAPAAPAQGMSLARQKINTIMLSEDARRQIMPLLPHGISFERVVSTIHQVVAENPDLLECTPESLIMAVGRGVKWDLDFGETVHLVPFNVNVAKRDAAPRWEKRAKAIRDWKGDIELVTKSGAARHVDAQCFYENEIFKYQQGTTPFIEHHPIFDVVKRGQMLGAYAWARISVHSLKIAVMSVAEIDAIRQEKSQSWKKGPLPDWYARKTMVHQVTKSLPKNPKLLAAMQAFKEEDDIPEGEFEVVSETPVAETPAVVAPAPPDPLGPASEGQIARLLELSADQRVAEKVRQTVEARLEKGITYQVAGKWISEIELSIGDELPLSKSA